MYGWTPGCEPGPIWYLLNLSQLRCCVFPVEVTAKGPIHRQTGMVVNIADMKIWIEKAVMNVMDHKNIDKDVPYFR